MLILLDHSTPAPLRYALRGHTVVEAIERTWEQLANGALLDAAEAAGFDLFITADKNIRYQQSLTGRKISIVVLGNSQWPVLRRYVERVVAAVNAAAGQLRRSGDPVRVILRHRFSQRSASSWLCQIPPEKTSQT